MGPGCGGTISYKSLKCHSCHFGNGQWQLILSGQGDQQGHEQTHNSVHGELNCVAVWTATLGGHGPVLFSCPKNSRCILTVIG